MSVTSQGQQGYYSKLVLNTSGTLIALLKLLANALQICFWVTLKSVTYHILKIKLAFSYRDPSKTSPPSR